MNSLQYYRSLVIFNGAIPLLMLGWDAYRGQLGANAVDKATPRNGDSCARVPVACAGRDAVAMGHRLGRLGRLSAGARIVRILLASSHLGIYIGLDRALSVSSTFHEIWSRRFLQVGARPCC